MTKILLHIKYHFFISMLTLESRRFPVMGKVSCVLLGLCLIAKETEQGVTISEAHHRVNGPDTGCNSGGRRIIKKGNFQTIKKTYEP